MEILETSRYGEYEEFVKHHKNGSITQSTLWHGIKDNWGHEVVVVRNDKGEITAGISILIKKVPVIGTAMLYAPRGPVCDYSNLGVLDELQKGIDMVAEKHKAHLFKVDPDITIDHTEFMNKLTQMGYVRFAEPTGFETIQTRFNYRIYLNGRDEEQVLMDMHHKTRYNIRLAGRRGVSVEVKGAEGLSDFMHLMEITGERDGFSIRSKEYFENMLKEGKGAVRLYLAYYEGKAIAGAISSNYAGKTQYIYGASDNEHRNVMAPYLIQWEMIRWAVETGCTVYDMMGVSGDMNPENPLYGLFRFKDGFTGQVDELAGEYDYIYKPFFNNMVNMGINVHGKLTTLKRKLKSSD